MEPIIYALSLDNQLQKNIDIHFDDNPNPKLIKYGFNNINEQIEILSITSNPHYKAGLNFDFDRTDENSIVTKISNTLNIKKVDSDFAEFWEILTIFKLTENKSIASNHPDKIKSILDVHSKYFETKLKYSIENIKNAKVAELVLYKYSEMDIDENAATQFIIDELSKLLSIQTKNSSMVLQLFNSQTQVTAEIIGFLVTVYRESYLYKPTVLSNLSDCKYLVLIGLKESTNFDVPKHADSKYLSSLGLQNLLGDVPGVIQCMNSDTIPKKYKKYIQIKNYLDSKVYEGATYQEMMMAQNKNVESWMEIFVNADKIVGLLDAALKKTSQECKLHSQLIGLF